MQRGRDVAGVFLGDPVTELLEPILFPHPLSPLKVQPAALVQAATHNQHLKSSRPKGTCWLGVPHCSLPKNQSQRQHWEAQPLNPQNPMKQADALLGFFKQSLGRHWEP